VIVERAFGALKGRFRILDNKPFHTYKTQVKLVLACCILHNWILGFGTNETVPHEEGFVGAVEEDEPSPSNTQDSGPCSVEGMLFVMQCGMVGGQIGPDHATYFCMVFSW
jgi:hypothetical protein